jgi:hypothetical protein
MDMTDEVAVGDGSDVQRSVVAAGTPTVVLFWARCEELKTRNSLSGELCLPATLRRIRLWR